MRLLENIKLDQKLSWSLPPERFQISRFQANLILLTLHFSQHFKFDAGSADQGKIYFSLHFPRTSFQ